MIENKYGELCSLLEQVQKCASELQHEIEHQGSEEKAFAALFFTRDLGKNVNACVETVSKAVQDLHQSADADIKKLPLMPEYVELKKSQERLQTAGVHLLLLLKKAGAKNADEILQKLLCGDVNQKVTEYNQSLEKLSHYAVNSDAFRSSMAIQKKKTFLPDYAPIQRQRTASFDQTSIKVGNIIEFGRYPQTRAGTDKTPIEWQVLERNGNKVLLISKYGLDVKPYHKIYEDITWETCTLRSWLNKDFLSKAFTAEEKRAIPTTAVNNSRSQCYSGWDTYGGNNTQDKIFLLSYAEANKYFNIEHYLINGAKDNMESRVELTAYAIAQGAYTRSDYKTMDGAASGWWWLRSPGNIQCSAAGVYYDGSLRSSRVINDSAVVRPALWLNLESEIFQS